MNTTDHKESEVRAFTKSSKIKHLENLRRAEEAQEREYIRLDARAMVLSTIDELNQYLLGNVTLEAATDACRELTHKLNASW